MRFACLFCIILLSTWQGVAQDIFPSRKNGLFGYIDTSGNWVISPRFIKAGLYQKGRAIATVDDTLYLIHNQNHISVLPGLRNYAELGKGFFALQDRSGKWALADSSFGLLSGFSYTKIEAADTLFKIWNNGVAGLIDRHNRRLLPEEFNKIEILSNGNYRAVNGNRTRIYKLKDSMNLMLDNVGIEYSQSFPNVYLQKLKKSKVTVFYSLDGDTLMKCYQCLPKAAFRDFLFISEGKGIVMLNTRNGEIRKNIGPLSSVIISKTLPQFMFLKQTGEFYTDSSAPTGTLGEGIDSIDYASDKYLFFRKDNLWGLIDYKGNIQIAPACQTISLIEDKWAEAYSYENKTLYYLPASKKILSTGKYAVISADTTSVLVYKPNNSVLYELNSEMEITDSAVFKNLSRFTAGRKQNVVSAGNVFQGVQNRNFSRSSRWFERKGYYGLKGLNNDTIYPAIFTAVYGINDSTDVVLLKSSFILLKTLPGKGVVYSDELYGILNNRNGRYYLAPVYAFIDYRMYTDTSMKVVRVVNKSGSFALMQKSDYSILSHTVCSYISPAYEGTMRLFYKAVFYAVEQQLPAGIKTYPKFLSSVFGFAEFGKLDVRNNLRNNVYVCASAVNVADKSGKLHWDYETAKKFTYLENGMFQNFISVDQEGKYGVINRDKNIIINNEYSFISRLQSDQHFFVLRSHNLKYGYVSNTGNELSGALFNEARMFHDLYAWARMGDSLVLIDHLGRIEDPGIKQTKTGPVSEGITSIKTRKGWILTDLNGEPVSELTFRQVKVFMNGSVAVLYGALWGLMDEGGQWLVKPTYADFEAENKNAIVFKDRNKFCFVSRDGIELAKVRVRGEMKAIGDLYFKMQNKTGTVIYRNDGSELRSRRFKGEVRAIGDTVLVLSNFRMVVWNNQGKRVNSLRHHGGAGSFDKGNVKIGEKKARKEYIELKIVDSYRFLYPGVFADSVNAIKIYKPRSGSSVTLVNSNISECIRHNVFVYELKNLGNGKWFVLSDSLGNLVCEHIFKNVKYIGGGMFKIEMLNQHLSVVSGVINASGLWILEPKFRNITEFKAGIAVYSKENDFWIADTNGILISNQPCVEYRLYKGYYFLLSEDMSGWWHPEKGWLAGFSK